MELLGASYVRRKTMHVNISAYNALVRRVASSHSIEFGIDTPKARHVQARWMRRIRKEIPLRNYGRTWA